MWLLGAINADGLGRRAGSAAVKKIAVGDEIRLRVGPPICWARLALAVLRRFMHGRLGFKEEDAGGGLGARTVARLQRQCGVLVIVLYCSCHRAAMLVESKTWLGHEN
jgi:hypothetical protein